MEKMKFREYMAQKPYVVADGAMGTYFSQINREASFECERANLFSPHIIEKIHGEYIGAGAKIIRTNTFAANTVSLNEDMETVKDIIEAGYHLALKAASAGEVFVFADMGPINLPDEKTINDEYFRIADIFLRLGANNFIFETFPDSQVIIALAQYIKEKNPNSYIIGEFAINPDGWTRRGLSGEKLIDSLSGSGLIDACGYNCISGPAHLLERIRRLDISPDCVISVMPNAGYPSTVNERTVFVTDPPYFAQVMTDIRQAGARILGGCCGTTPAHIKALVKALQGDLGEDMPQVRKRSGKAKIKPVDNVFKNKLLAGKKVIAVELDPPVSSDTSSLIRGAEQLKFAGADIITIADCPLSRARADSSIIGAKVFREAKIQSLPHLTCRDRNLNAIKALLLGLHSENIRNVLAVTGDPIPEDLRKDIKGVFSFNSFMLIKFINELNSSDFESDPMYIGAALNINAPNFSIELNRAMKKIENGADFFLTQPLFVPRAEENLKTAFKTLDKPLLAGIMPVVSYRNAIFLKNEIPGIDISDDFCNIFLNLDREEAQKKGIEIAVKTASKVIDFCDGIYLITPFNRWKMTGEITRHIRKMF